MDQLLKGYEELLNSYGFGSIKLTVVNIKRELVEFKADDINVTEFINNTNALWAFSDRELKLLFYAFETGVLKVDIFANSFHATTFSHSGIERVFNKYPRITKELQDAWDRLQSKIRDCAVQICKRAGLDVHTDQVLKKIGKY